MILRGLLAGTLAAVVAFVFARLFVEPVIGRAIIFEDGRTAVEQAQGVHEHGAELFTRGVQSNVGLGFGVLIFGVAMGALFAVAFCVVYARAGATSHAPQRLSLLLAAAALTAVYLVPFLKYPPNPPAVGQEDTIGVRTTMYLVAVLASTLLAGITVWVAGRLAERLGGVNAGLVGCAAYVAAVAVVYVLLPDFDETPEPMRNAAGAVIYPGFPADVLYEFRLLSLGTQGLLWTTIGVVFGALAGRLLGKQAGAEQVSSIAA